jgi:hypothetical protein
MAGKVGQPTVMTEETLRLLQEAFEWGCTDIEACLHAQIGKTALYDYQNRNPEYAEWKEQWKNSPNLRARKCVVESLDTDKDLALKYLERKKKDEFSLRNEHTGADGNALFAWQGDQIEAPSQPLTIEGESEIVS